VLPTEGSGGAFEPLPGTGSPVPSPTSHGVGVVEGHALPRRVLHEAGLNVGLELAKEVEQLRQNAQAKGRRYLTEGRLVITHADGDRVRATCRGDGCVYELEVKGEDRACTCPAMGRCAHLIALGSVTAPRGTASL
jgi:hypothetical protein